MKRILATMPLQQKVDMLQEAAKAKAIVLRLLPVPRNRFPKLFDDEVWGVIDRVRPAIDSERDNARKFAVDLQYTYVLEKWHGEGCTGVWWVHDKADFIIFDSELEFKQYRLAVLL